ncbi:acyl-CoA dehydrogenase domain-containing protein [Riemerella anatipestifer CH3]|nr:acyl-CoA dehydrogenase domain-containing protein [Riemerella anatipestifer CH3]
MLDSLLTEEHKLVRNSVRQWVQSSVIPQIDNAVQTHKEIPNLMQQLGKIGALGAYIPKKYGGAGLDQISYGIIMQELERGDSAVRSAASVQSSLVMYPIFEFGTEEQKENSYLYSERVKSQELSDLPNPTTALIRLIWKLTLKIWAIIFC